MKNKLNILILIFGFFFLISENSNANDDDFIFESDSIEFLENGNLIKASNDVKIKTNNGLIINSQKSIYSKITKKLKLIGDVIIIDEKKNITIQSEIIEYDKISELITSKNETSINIENDFNIIKISEVFNFMTAKIEFCIGLALYKQDILITFGFQDNCSFIVKINKDNLIDFIHNKL